MIEVKRRILLVHAIGEKLGLTTITGFTTHSVKQDLLLPVWISSLTGDSGDLPTSFSQPPEDFQVDYYSFRELTQLSPDTPLALVPSPGIVLALHNSKLSPEIVRSVVEDHEGVAEFIEKDTFSPDTTSYDVFLCYAAADSRRADALRGALASAGLRCFMAEKSLQAGDLWSEEIRKALVSSKEMCLLCTPNSIRSEWVLTEWGAAWALSKRVVPVLHRVDVADLPERLRSHQVVDFTDHMMYVMEAAQRLR